VKGDLHTPSLQIDKGVIFEGRSFMEGTTAPAKAAPADRAGTSPGTPAAGTTPSGLPVKGDGPKPLK
jgi:cytoskeletal protein CcmA (bactofilin family)